MVAGLRYGDLLHASPISFPLVEFKQVCCRPVGWAFLSHVGFLIYTLTLKIGD
jgi:hypothetical protein